MPNNLRRFFAWLMLWSTVGPALSPAIASEFHPTVGQVVVYKNPNDEPTPPRRARVTSVDSDKGWCWIEFLEFFPSAHNRQEHCPIAHLSPAQPSPPPLAAAKGSLRGHVDVASALARRML